MEDQNFMWMVIGVLGTVAATLIAYTKGIFGIGKSKGAEEKDIKELHDNLEDLKKEKGDVENIENHFSEFSDKIEDVLNKVDENSGEIHDLKDKYQDDHEMLTRIDERVKFLYDNGREK